MDTSKIWTVKENQFAAIGLTQKSVYIFLDWFDVEYLCSRKFVKLSKDSIFIIPWGMYKAQLARKYVELGSGPID